MKPTYGVAAEVLQIKDPVSASMLGMIAASLVSELSPANGEASPSLVEGETDPLQSTFIVRPDDSDLSEVSTEESGSSGQTAVVPQSTVDSAQSEVLPAVLNELLTSPLHEPAVQSPHVISHARSALPSLGDGGNEFHSDSSTQGSAGGPSSSAPPAGLGNTQPATGKPIIDAAPGLDAETLISSGPAVPTTQSAASGEQGDIQPLQIETQSKPASGGFGELTTFGESVENEPPFADDDYYSILHDTSLNEFAPGVMANDWDMDFDPLDAVLDSGPSFASSFTFYSDGSFDYEPISAWAGMDSFTYHVSDGLDDSESATVTIEVTNELPFADDDYYSILHDTTLTEFAPGVIANDWDMDGDDISNSATLDVGPTNGTLNYFNSDGSFEYVPNAAWSGIDSFTYHVNDGLGDSNIATVTIEVTNEIPFADGEFFTILQGTTLRRSLPGVLANDWDNDNDPLTANLITDVSNGSLTLNEDGSFSYTPFSQFLGIDSFTYVASDGVDESFEATVDIEVVEWYLNIRLDSNNDGSYYDPDDELVEMDDPGMVFGVNDDDDNQNGIIDSDPTESPFLIEDAEGNSVPINDDDLVKAELEYGDSSEMAEGDKEGLQLQLTSSSSDIQIWSSPWKEYDWTGAKFVFEQDQVPRWYAPDGSPIVFPSEVYLEGKKPGTAVVSLALLDNMDVKMGDDKAKATDVKVDIDIDSDNDGTIEEAEDINEGASPGNLLWQNYDDDNENDVPDFQDNPTGNPPRFRKPDNTVVQDDELEEVTLSIDAGGTNIDGYTLEVFVGENVKLWKTRDKEALPENLKWTVGEEPAFPTTFYAEGVSPGQTTIKAILSKPLPPGAFGPAVTAHLDYVRLTVHDYDITGYRPQTEYFPKTAVPGDVEHTLDLGVGIRRNGDDDNNNGIPDLGESSETGIAGENDLIEVELFGLPLSEQTGSIESIDDLRYTLRRSNDNIRIWTSANKTDDENDGELLVASPPGEDIWIWDANPETNADGKSTIWVEWVEMDSGQTSAQLTFSVWDTFHNQMVGSDTLTFHPFNSIIIGFMGEFQDPSTDTDQGMYEMSYELYKSGYDARIYEEDDMGDDYTPDENTGWFGERDSFEAIANAVDNRGVVEAAIFGYSHGGGATFRLANVLLANGWTDDDDPTNGPEPLQLDFTAYIDGIGKGADPTDPAKIGPETRLPPGSDYHYNIYQSLGIDLHGASVAGSDFDDDTDVDEAGADFYWVNGLTHTQIDNQDEIQSHLLGALKARIIRQKRVTQGDCDL